MKLYQPYITTLMIVLLTAAITFVYPTTVHGQCEVVQIADTGGLGFVSIDGDVSIVGDTQAFGSLGAVYVFRRGPDGPQDWTLEATLMAPEPNTSDVFGRAVDVSGDVIVVAALGAVATYIFRYDGVTLQWAYEATLTASDAKSAFGFGFSVSIDGDVAVIGARDAEINGMFQAGSAFVFRYDPDTSGWVEESMLTDPDGEERDLFGVSVSIRRDGARIGAHGNDHVWNMSGSAFVFRYDRGSWFLEAELADFDDPNVGWFGWDVSLADGVAVVGAFRDNSKPGGSDAGSAYIYRLDGSSWVEEQKITASDADPLDWFGQSVSISEDANSILIGAPDDEAQGFESGSAYLFRYTGDTETPWTEVKKLVASDGGPGDHFGGSVSVSKDIGLVKGGGKGYVFTGVQGVDCNENGQPDDCDIFDGTSDDLNNNGIPDECETPGDLDGDGVVGVKDLLILLGAWGACPDCDNCPADLNGDCLVGVLDLLILLGHWGS